MGEGHGGVFTDDAETEDAHMGLPRVGHGAPFPGPDLAVPVIGVQVAPMAQHIGQGVLGHPARHGGVTPLIETFVETPRYTGAVYRASGSIHVGATQGRGRYDRDRKFDKPKKDVWLRPLRRDWKRTLNR